MTKVMRIGIILVIALGLSLPVSAQRIGLGLDADMFLKSSTEPPPPNTTSETTTRTYLGIGANVILRMSDVLEITPFLKYSIESTKVVTVRTNTVAGVEIPSTSTAITENSSLTLGSAFYWHMIRGDVVELSLGPKAFARLRFQPKSETTTESSAGSNTSSREYEKYLNLDFNISADVVMDVKFNPSLMFRMTLTPASLNFNVFESQFKDAKHGYKSSTFTLDTLAERTRSTPVMTFGLIYMFN